jgi:hypothetical protein
MSASAEILSMSFLLAQLYSFPTSERIKNAGLIKGNIEGNSICYCIDENAFVVLNVFFSKVISTVKKQNVVKFFCLQLS